MDSKASFPQAPYDSTTNGTQTQSSSLHLVSLEEWFLSSVVSATTPVVTLIIIIIIIMNDGGKKARIKKSSQPRPVGWGGSVGSVDPPPPLVRTSSACHQNNLFITSIHVQWCSLKEGKNAIMHIFDFIS